MPLPAGGGVLVPAEAAALLADVFAGFAGADVLAAGAAAGAEALAGAAAGAGLDAGAVVEAGAAAGAGAAEASALALVFLLLLLAAGVAAVVVAAGAVDEPGVGESVESAAAFFDRVFFVVAAESLDASGVALASAAAFFDRVFLAGVAESAEAAGVAEESAAAVFDDFVFVVLLVAAVPLAELSAPAALESAAAFFLDLLFDDAAVEESSVVVESAAAAFLVFFFVVLVLLSALESLCVSCARTCVVNRNKPISAATASMKNRDFRILFIAILRVVRVWSLRIVKPDGLPISSLAVKTQRPGGTRPA
jgi:hypothetical protein